MKPFATKLNGLFVALMFVAAVWFLVFRTPNTVYRTIITIGFTVPLPIFIFLRRFRDSAIFGEAARTYFAGLMFLASLEHDKTFGFNPTFWGVMFGFSVMLLVTSLREKKTSEKRH